MFRSRKAEEERIEKLEKMVDDQTAMIEVLKRKGVSGGGKDTFMAKQIQKTA